MTELDPSVQARLDQARAAFKDACLGARKAAHAIDPLGERRVGVEIDNEGIVGMVVRIVCEDHGEEFAFFPDDPRYPEFQINSEALGIDADSSDLPPLL